MGEPRSEVSHLASGFLQMDGWTDRQPEEEEAGPDVFPALWLRGALPVPRQIRDCTRGGCVWASPSPHLCIPCPSGELPGALE